MIIAEIGINHNGNLDLCLDMIKKSKKAGADVVKFQKRNPEICVPEEQKSVIKHTPWGDMSYIDYKKRIEFGKNEFDIINKYCKDIGIMWTASAWDCDSFDFLMNYDIPFIKLASASITNKKLIDRILKTDIPIVLSTGMSTNKEVFDCITHINNSKKDRELTVLHCNSSYPSPINEINLNTINFIKDKYKVNVGYSGHEEGIIPTLFAIAMGVDVVERHVTLDKGMWGSDQSASITFDELETICKAYHDRDIIMGEGKIGVYSSEVGVRAKLRKE